MSVVLFDTHAFVKRLTAAGMPEAQAEVLADEQARLIDERLATKTDLEKYHLATKNDLEKLQLATKTDLEKLRESVKLDISEARSDILKWMFGAMGFQSLVLLAAAVALAKVFH